MGDDAEQAALIERMLVSRFFNRAVDRSDLLRFLYHQKSRLMSAKDIEVEFFEGSSNDEPVPPHRACRKKHPVLP